MANILEQIVADKRVWLQKKMASLPLAEFIDKVEPSDRDFVAALQAEPTAFILECKKASPSKGLIRDPFDLDAITSVYSQYATAISVLSDEQYFQGDFDYVTRVRNQVSQPVLCKDFMIDEYQVYLARYHQADAILLMLSVLDDLQYNKLFQLASTLNLGVLTEVSNEQELERAIALGSPVIGINNRNLRDLSTDIARTFELAPKIPKDRVVISESGIYHHYQVKQLCKVAQGFLVGSSLMAEPDLDKACRKLILGHNKVCGLTRPEDAAIAANAGAVYGGLIFVSASPRAVNLEQARCVMTGAPLDYVGVFQNATVNDVAATAITLGLAAVQLHGDEDRDYIQALKRKLAENAPASNVEIWKAHGVKAGSTENQMPDLDQYPVDRHLFDSKIAGQSGGTGQRFNWQLLNQLPLNNIMLAGGLTPDNASQAASIGAMGLDLNSGVESAPGVKNSKKLHDAFSAIRAY